MGSGETSPSRFAHFSVSLHCAPRSPDECQGCPWKEDCQLQSPPKSLLASDELPSSYRTRDTLVCQKSRGHSWGLCQVCALPSRRPCFSCSAVDEVAWLLQGLGHAQVMWARASHCHVMHFCTTTFQGAAATRVQHLQGTGVGCQPQRCQWELLPANKLCVALSFQAPSAKTHSQGSLGQSRQMPTE